VIILRLGVEMRELGSILISRRREVLCKVQHHFSLICRSHFELFQKSKVMGPEAADASAHQCAHSSTSPWIVGNGTKVLKITQDGVWTMVRFI